MIPNNKFRSIVFTITTAILFFTWTLLADFIKDHLIFGIPLGAVISLGTYRLILHMVESLISKYNMIKKLVFGNSYLEGVWVGYYFGIDNKPKFYIEYYEQDLNGLTIRGFTYKEDGTLKGTWISDKVFINEDYGTITYTYVTDMIQNTNKNQGLASFNFLRENKYKVTDKMVGFSSDIFSPQKLESSERRLSKKELKLSSTEKINLAKNLYKENIIAEN